MFQMAIMETKIQTFFQFPLLNDKKLNIRVTLDQIYLWKRFQKGL